MSRTEMPELGEYGTPAGAVNAWVCDTCGRATVAVHKDRGVTPFMLACRATDGCKGAAKSMFYRRTGSGEQPTHEWYRPDDLAAVSPAMQDHVRQGGLLIRRIDGKPEWWEHCTCPAPALLGHRDDCPEKGDSA